ncbi:MAG TPA: hypothetical protein PKI11_20390 [Candidatus Hydrogenedentes bacterium]|nr:hypothetical protein [Candidatus Hydrogenedentota bacterium]
MLYYVKVPEFLVLAAISLTLCLLNYAIRERWSRERNATPPTVAAIMWLIASAVCLLVSLSFYENTPVVRRLPVLMWCLLLFIPPIIYYAYSVIDSLAVRGIDRIGPFSARIEDPSEFAQARRMALRGDIDGAVQLYRRYQSNAAAALFEAVRLLKSVDRFVEAGLLLEEIAARFPENRNVWAEATYQLAKMHEVNLGERATALTLLRNLMNRAPLTRFGQMAATDVARLYALEDRTAEEDVAEDFAADRDPFYRAEGTPAAAGANPSDNPAGSETTPEPGEGAPPDTSDQPHS